MYLPWGSLFAPLHSFSEPPHVKPPHPPPSRQMTRLSTRF